MVEILLNGKQETMGYNTVHELIKGKNIESRSLIVEHNYKIIRKEDWDKTYLSNGDRLELLRFVGGG